MLGYTYSELCDLDTVKVELVPEKKGIILKHLEYEVTSRVCVVQISTVISVKFGTLVCMRWPSKVEVAEWAVGSENTHIEQQMLQVHKLVNYSNSCSNLTVIVM